MLASAFLSMWMSNTAAMMMLPIVFQLQLWKKHGQKKRFTANVMAWIIGGIATLSQSFLSFRIFEIIYPNARNFFWSVASSFACHWLIMFVFAVLYIMFPPQKILRNY
jgi:hypothetical protein